MPNASLPTSNAGTTTGLFRASGKRERSDAAIQRRRIEVIALNRVALLERDTKLAKPRLPLTKAIPDAQRGSSSVITTSVIGALAFAIVAVSMTFGIKLSVPTLGLFISSPFAAALAGGAFGAAIGALLGQLIKPKDALDMSEPENDSTKRPLIFKTSHIFSLVQRTRFQQEWTNSNLG